MPQKLGSYWDEFGADSKRCCKWSTANLKIGINDDAKGFVEEKAAREKTPEADIVRRAVGIRKSIAQIGGYDAQMPHRKLH
jgi:hypothetical protein